MDTKLSRSFRNLDKYLEAELINDIFRALQTHDTISIKKKDGKVLHANSIGYISEFKQINDNKELSVWLKDYDIVNVTPISEIKSFTIL